MGHALPQLNNQNPNPAAATIGLERDALGRISFMTIEREGGLESYSPLAQAIFRDFPACRRIDFINQSGNTLVSANIKPAHWDAAGKQKLQALVGHFLDGGEMPVLADSLLQNIPAACTYVPIPKSVPALICQTFYRAVLPVIAEDGGSMKIRDVRIGDDQGIDIDVALLGACNGCPQALTGTIEGAKDAVNGAIDQLKKKYPEKTAVNGLNLRAINIVNPDFHVFVSG